MEHTTRKNYSLCINLLKPISSNSGLSYIDQNLKSYEWGVNVELEIQPLLQSIEHFSNFLPLNMRASVKKYLENIEDPRNIDQIGNLLGECQVFINQLVNKEALFFAG